MRQPWDAPEWSMWGSSIGLSHLGPDNIPHLKSSTHQGGQCGGWTRVLGESDYTAQLSWVLREPPPDRNQNRSPIVFNKAGQDKAS